MLMQKRLQAAMETGDKEYSINRADMTNRAMLGMKNESNKYVRRESVLIVSQAVELILGVSSKGLVEYGGPSD